MRIADGDGNWLDSILLAPSHEEAAELAQALASLRSRRRAGTSRSATPPGSLRSPSIEKDDESAVF
jgi:hypothetical protein